MAKRGEATRLPAIRKATPKVPVIGVFATSDPRIDEESRTRCQNIAQMAAETISGAVVLPGLVNGHTHLYSALAVGMPPPPWIPRGFLEILQLIWWRLDQALDAESIELSARIGAIAAARCGTTTLIDHHASPNVIDGALGPETNAIGRHHPGGDRLGGTANFLYVDGHVERTTILETLKERRWGDKYYAITGNNIVIDRFGEIR